ncbi:MAG TPA: hypothetical protein VI318_00405 [Baekduia sp.]
MSLETEHHAATSTEESTAIRRAQTPVVLDDLMGVLLATAAVFVGVGGLIIGAVGPAEVWETRLWIIAIVIGVPGGQLLARRWRDAGALAPMGVALAALVLGIGFVLRWHGTNTTTYNLLLGVSGVAAALAPFAATRVRPSVADAPGWRTATWVALAILLVPFVPASTTQNAALLNAAIVAGIVYAALRLAPPLRLGRGARIALDVVLAGLLFGLVLQLPTLPPQSYLLVHHQDFYLGPINDASHGRQALVDVWSQYGIGMIQGLKAVFWVVPLSYGGLSLISGLATGVQYVVLYATLRAATGRVVLVGVAVVATAFGQAFNLYGTYIDYPSIGPLRFGTPYLVVGLAVWAALRPERARRLRWLQLAVVALAALWSFETGVYAIVTLGAIMLVERLAGDGPVLRGLARDVLELVGAVVAGVVVYTLAVLVFAGTPHWGPYVDYIKLYEKGFGAVPVLFFSSGPLMGALTILSAAGLGWVVLQRRVAIPAAQRVALAGFTGFAMATYTYYLGRSVPDNLGHILPPVAAYLTVWTSVFLDAAGRRAARGVPAIAAAALVFAGAAVAVNAWPSVKIKWRETALAQTIPFADGEAAGSGRSIRASLEAYWHQPVMDPRSVDAVAQIDRYWKPGQPVLSLMASDLTTETLMRAGRRNLLPMSHPLEDSLIASSEPRVQEAVAKVPAGTLMLLNDAKIAGPPAGFEEAYPKLEVHALASLRRRFQFHTVERSKLGISVVRLDPRS